MKNNKRSTIEIWFGGRKNKKLLELKIDSNHTDDFINDVMILCDKYNVDARKLWKPNREPDISIDGFDFWLPEGLFRTSYVPKNHVERFFIKPAKDDQPAEILFQNIMKRRQVVKPYRYHEDAQQNEKLLSDVMNAMILGNIENKEEDDL